MARALFFGRLRDAAGCGERTIALDRVVDFPTFRKMSAEGDDQLEELLSVPSVRIAVNAALVPTAATCSISPGDEVAFMPPFSGG